MSKCCEDCGSFEYVHYRENFKWICDNCIKKEVDENDKQ